MTQEQRAKDLQQTVFNSNTFELTLKDICECLAKDYDFTPKVKELEWEDCQSGDYETIQNNIIIWTLYRISNKEGLFYSKFLMSKKNADLGIFKSLAEAKSACQEHYRTTVLSLLEL